MNAFKADLRRAFQSFSFLLSVLIAFGVLFRPLLSNWLAWGFRGVSANAMELLSEPLALSSFTPFAVLFCVLPYSISFCEDVNSGYIRPIVARIGMKRYIRNRIISVICSGALAIGLPFAIIVILCVVGATQPITLDTINWLSPVWASLAGNMNGTWMYVVRIILAMAFGAAWATFGLCVSTLISNRYVTLIAPFVIYQALWALLPESKWNPLYQLRADFQGIPSLWFSFAYQGIAICALASVSAWRIRRRLLR